MSSFTNIIAHETLKRQFQLALEKKSVKGNILRLYRTYTRLVEKVKISLIGTLIDMSKLKSNFLMSNNYQIVRILQLVVHFSFPNNTGGRERKHQPDGS